MVRNMFLLRLSLFVLLLETAQSSNPFRVNSFTLENQKDPEVAALGTDKIVLVWESYGQDGSQRGVYGRVINVETGQDVLAEFRVNVHTDHDQDDAAVAAIGDDKFVVVWESQYQETGGSGNGVFLRVMSITGQEVLAPMQVNQHVSNSQADAAVAVIGGDKIVIVWESEDQDGSDKGIFARVIDLTGANVLAEFQVNTYVEGDQSDPVVAALGNDKFVVAWESESDSGPYRGVYARVFSTTGATLVPEFRVDDQQHASGSKSDPSVAALGSDKFVVVWESGNQEPGGEGGHGVYARVLSSSGAEVLAETRVNTHTDQDQDNPSVAALDDDKFVVVWESWGQDGGEDGGEDEGVYGRVLSARGEQVLAEFALNNHTANDQETPHVAALSATAFVATWESYQQDGSADGVYARVMRLPAAAPSCPNMLLWSNCRQSHCCAAGLVCYAQNDYYAQCLEAHACRLLYAHLDGGEHAWSCAPLSPDPTPACERREAEWGNCAESHCCAEGLVCYQQNKWYAQCLQPGTCGSRNGHLTGEYAWTCAELSARSSTASYALALSASGKSASSLDAHFAGTDGAPNLALLLGVGAAAVVIVVAGVLALRRRGSGGAGEARGEVALKSELAFEGSLPQGGAVRRRSAHPGEPSQA